MRYLLVILISLVYNSLFAQDFFYHNETFIQHFESQRFDSALVHYEKALALVPDVVKEKPEQFVSFLLLGADCYEKNGDTQSAILTLEKAFPLVQGLVQAPNQIFIKTSRNLARLYKQVRAYEKAEAIYREALLQTPKDSLSYAFICYDLAILNYNYLDQVPIADSLFSIIIRQERWYKQTDFLPYLENIAKFYQNINKPAQAELIYQQFNQKAQVNTEQTLSKQFINQIKIYEQQKEFSKADSLSTRLLKVLETSKSVDSTQLGEALYNWAYLKHYQLQEQSVADSLYEKAKEILQNIYPSTHPRLGDIFYHQGIRQYEQKKWRDAISLFEAVKKIRSIHQDSIALANALQNLAELNRLLKNYEKADQYYRQTFNIYTKYPQQTKESFPKALERYAQLLVQRRAFYQADSIYTYLANLYAKETSLSSSYLNVLCYQARNAYLNNRLAKAAELYEKVLQLAAQLQMEDTPVYSKTLLRLIDVYLSQGKNEKADEVYQRIQPENHRNTEWETYIRTLINISNRYFNQGFFTRAEEGFQQALRIWEKHSPHLSLLKAEILQNFGILKGTLSAFDEAQNYFQEALLIYKQQPEHQSLYAHTLVYLAQIYRQTEYIHKAEPLLQQALAIQETSLNTLHPDYLYTLQTLGSYYQSIGQINQAEIFFQNTIDLLADSLGTSHPNYAQTLRKLANIYASNPQKEKQTQTMLQEVIRIYQDNFGNQSLEYAQALNDLSRFYNQLGRRTNDSTWHQKALDIYPKVIQITQKFYGNESLTYAINLLNLAIFCEYGSQLKQAEKNYLQALTIIKKQLSPKHPKYFAALNNLALFYEKQENYAKAAPLYLEAVENTLALIQDNFPSFSELEKRSFYAINKPYFDNFMVFGANLYSRKEVLKNTVEVDKIIGKIYDLQLATKAMILQATNQIRTKIQKSQNQSLKNTYEQWKYSRDIISKYYTSESYTNTQTLAKLDSLEKLAQRLEKDLVLSLNTSQDKYFEPLPSWKDIQQTLKPGEVAIEIIQLNTSNEDSIYVALLLSPQTTQHPELVVIKNAQELDRKFFKQYKNSIHAKKTDRYSYEKYWQPLKDKLIQMYDSTLSRVNRIYFSPDGVYHLVNLYTLYNLKDRTYLIDEVEIVRLSNTKELIPKVETRAKPSLQALIMGRPTYQIGQAKPQGWLSDADISDLPGTEIEVKKIDAILKASQWNTQLYLGTQASEENIKNMASPTVLHVATHGFFVHIQPPSSDPDTRLETKELMELTNRGLSLAPENQRKLEIYYDGYIDAMLRSGIILAGINNYSESNSNDGILTAYEASALNLNDTDLVVLSACETGAGEVQNGEGVYGLQRAILVAGAKSVLMSLWPVEDRATQKLMVTFYQEWLSGKSKREAFKLAQLKVRSQSKYPFFWGAFVLIGE